MKSDPLPSIYMADIEPDMQRLRQEIGFEPDGRWRNWWVEVITSHTLRDLRASYLGLAFLLNRSPESEMQALCVLVDSRITPERLDVEIQLLQEVMRPEISSRISIAQYSMDGELIGAPPVDDNFPAWLIELVRHESNRTGRPGGTQQTVFAHLIMNWLDNSKPLTRTAIQSASGASYPTVANALKKLEAMDILELRSDRRVELKRFPWDEWRRWVISNQDARKTVVFSDKTGKGRSTQSMLERLKQLGREDIAIGGVIGAKHYFPKLDISGNVRLDLTIKGNKRTANLDFVRQLDAGLVESRGSNEVGSVAVHFSDSRADNMFMRDSNGVVWANPVQCLVDLYELRLEMQAQEMLQFLVDERIHQQNIGSKK